MANESGWTLAVPILLCLFSSGFVRRLWEGKYCTVSLGSRISSRTARRESQCSGKKLTSNCASGSNPNPVFLHLGICVPKTCTTKDMNIILKCIFKKYNIENCGDHVDCHESPGTNRDAGFIVMIFICSIILFLMLSGTLFDVFVYQGAIERLPDKKSEKLTAQQEIQKNKGKVATLSATGTGEVVDGEGASSSAPIVNMKTKTEYYNQLAVYWKSLLAFSVYTNGTKLLSVHSSEGDLSCIHGIRFFSMSWIILGHVFYFCTRFLDNPVVMVQYPTIFSWQIINNATVSVDTFFVLSGFLLSFLWLKKMHSTRGKQLKSPLFWLMYYIHRIIRLTPTYMLLLGVAITVFPHLGEGPMWKGSDEGVLRNCPNAWWSNLLYLNNFFYLETGKMCLGWTWYLADDMQFYIFTPPVLILFYYFPVVAAVICLILMIGSAVGNGIIVISKDYPPTVITTVDPSIFYDLEAYSRDVYFKPYMRWTPYIMGIMLGYILHRTRNKFRISRIVALAMWLLIVIVTSGVVFGLYDYAKGMQLSPVVKALYSALNRPFWGAAVCGVIYLCLQGYGGAADRFLSWKIWNPLSRLTFCAYLIHPLVIIYYYSTLRKPEHGNDYNMVYHFIASMVVSYALAVVASLAFESPVIQLEKIWLDPRNWKKMRQNRPTGFEPLRNRLLEIRSQLQTGFRRNQSRGRP